MPKPGTNTPISDEEAIEFANRMATGDSLEESLDGAEAMRASGVWREFVADKLRDNRGVEPSNAVLNVLERGREGAYIDLPRIGITAEVVHPRPGVNQRVYRDSRGRFTSAATVRALIPGFTLRR